MFHFAELVGRLEQLRCSTFSHVHYNSYRLVGTRSPRGHSFLVRRTEVPVSNICLPRIRQIPRQGFV